MLALQPAVRVAARAGVSLEEFTHIAQRGYFEHLQAQGASFVVLARRLGKSRRTIADMAKRFRERNVPSMFGERARHEQSLFSALVVGRGIIRRSDVDDETWNRHRHTAERLLGIIDLRVDDDGIYADAERYAYLTDDIERRLGSAANLMALVADVLDNRFLSRAPEPPFAFVRVLTSRAACEVEPLVADAYQAARERLVEADRVASHETSDIDNAVTLRAAFLVTSV